MENDVKNSYSNGNDNSNFVNYNLSNSSNINNNIDNAVESVDLSGSTYVPNKLNEMPNSVVNEEKIGGQTKDVNYYRKLLHFDTIALLIVSILSGILSVVSVVIPVFLKSVLFIIFEVIILVNKKETNKTVGILAVVNGVLMILTSIGDGSLFGIAYILLGIIYIIHSAIYLNNLKKTSYNSEFGYYDEKQNTKLKFLTVIANIVSLLFVVVFFLDNVVARIIIFSTIVVMNILNIIFCLKLNKKYKKSIFVYITMTISIFAVLINGLMLVDDVGSEIHNKYSNDVYTYES